VEGLHPDEEGLAWAPGGQVEPWAVDKQGPVGGLLLDAEEPVRDEGVLLGAGDVQAARGELPQGVENLQQASEGLGVLMPQLC